MERKSINTLTSDDLDELYVRIEYLEAELSSAKTNRDFNAWHIKSLLVQLAIANARADLLQGDANADA